MNGIRGTIGDIQFRTNDSEPTRVQKLELLRTSLLSTAAARTIYASITDGLPAADPAEPLLRFRLVERMTISAIAADAGVGATGTPALRIRKDGAANGTISFTGTAGTATVTDPVYEAGSLFEIYPPATADATLDDVSISISATVG